MTNVTHTEEHERILAKMDSNQEVTENKMKIVLLEERIKEMKEDKERAAGQIRTIAIMAFSIIMAVAGSSINQMSTVEVLREKVAEQKSEIEEISKYAHEHDN